MCERKTKLRSCQALSPESPYNVADSSFSNTQPGHLRLTIHPLDVITRSVSRMQFLYHAKTLGLNTNRQCGADISLANIDGWMWFLSLSLEQTVTQEIKCTHLSTSEVCIECGITFFFYAVTSEVNTATLSQAIVITQHLLFSRGSVYKVQKETFIL